MHKPRLHLVKKLERKKHEWFTIEELEKLRQLELAARAARAAADEYRAKLERKYLKSSTVAFFSCAAEFLREF